VLLLLQVRVESASTETQGNVRIVGRTVRRVRLEHVWVDSEAGGGLHYCSTLPLLDSDVGLARGEGPGDRICSSRACRGRMGGREEVVSLLKEAIGRGVPAFNSGDHAGCARIYASAAGVSNNLSISLSLPPSLPPTTCRADTLILCRVHTFTTRHGDAKNNTPYGFHCFSVS
jgi:hypothetical protein